MRFFSLKNSYLLLGVNENLCCPLNVPTIWPALLIPNASANCQPATAEINSFKSFIFPPL
jgi:hypothetical protein